jgi:hypothetical protein
MADLLGLRIPGAIDNKASGAGGWPNAGKAMINSTEYASIAAAITAAAAGDIIKIGQGTFTETLTVDEVVTLVALDPTGTIITSASSATITVTSAGAAFRNLTIKNTAGGGTDSTVIQSNVNNCVYENCVFVKTGAADDSACILQYGGTGTLVINCELTTSGATKNYAVWNNTATASIEVRGGKLNGSTYDIFGDQTGSSIGLYSVLLVHNSINWAGAIERSGNVSFERARPDPIVNGSFLRWDRGTSFAAVASGDYTADRFVYSKVGVMVHTVTQDATVPTVAQAGVKAPFSIKLDVTTIDASIAAGDACLLQHIMEGYNFSFLAQKQFTVSFWARDTKTGIHCISFRNSGGDRSYVVEFTIVTADTWEYFTVTVPPSPSAGTWDYTTGKGLIISWALACGSTFQTTANAWQTGLFYGTANQVNAVDNTANNFYLALVKSDPGAISTPFILPDTYLEIERCQRNRRTLGGDYVYHFLGAGHTASTTSCYATILFFPEMAKIPTVTSPTASTIGVMDNTGTIIALTTLSVIHPTKSSMLAVLGWAGGTFVGAGQAATLTSNNTTSGKFLLEAEP